MKQHHHDRSENGRERANHLLHLLQADSHEEFRRISEHLEPVMLEQHFVIAKPGEEIEWVYFPTTCVASIVKILADGKQVEVGTAGFEGMAGLPVFLDARATPLKCVAQVGGHALRLPAEALRELASGESALHAILQRYAQYLYDQAAQSLACNQLHTIEKRCARWLLMTHDRVVGDMFELTQEYLATMLGVRRPSVSQAAESLQRLGLIHYRRGKIMIVNREGLEAAACECYESDRKDFERLLGGQRRPIFARAG